MNIAHIIDDHPADSVALIYRNTDITFGELRSSVDSFRSGLAAAGVTDGDRVLIVCANSDVFVIAYLAIVGLGAIAIPLNPTSPAPELTAQIQAVNPAAAVVGPAGIAEWHRLDPEVRDPILTITAESAEGLARTIDVESLLATPATVAVADRQDSDVAAMIFTSGTAGAPKAAMLTHGNLLASLDSTAKSPDPIRADDLVYGVLPLFHIFGLNVQLAGSLRAGATLLLIQRFDPLTAAESISARQVTVVPGAPALWLAISQFDELPADTFASVRLAYSGAAKLSVKVAEDMRSRFGISIGEGYGLTEASPVVTSSAGIEHRLGSVGKAVAGVEVRVVDEHDTIVPVGDTGEVHVRGANVFVGYLDDPEATARVLTDDGWLRTGDIGFTDEDGYLYLVDRAKDLIIVSGFNVFPAEVEEVLRNHPGVTDAAVIGVPHPHTGEAVRAYVVASDETLDEDALVDFCRDHLARYKCPSKVMFSDRLPRNASGKLVRRELAGTVIED